VHFLAVSAECIDFCINFCISFCINFCINLCIWDCNACEVSSLPSSWLGSVEVVVCWCWSFVGARSWSAQTSTRCYIYMGAHKSDDK
jgi:hypothetical protein